MSQDRAYENCKFASAIKPQTDITTAGTTYNGAAAASSTYIDILGYDGATIVLDTGTFGGNGTATVTIVTGSTDDPAAATAVTGAAFTAVDTSNDETQYTGYVLTNKYDRYLWVKNVKGGTGNAPVACTVVLDRFQKRPVLARTSLSFCVDASA